MPNHLQLCAFTTLAIAFTAATSPANAADDTSAPQVHLASGGKALLPVVVPPKPTARVQKAAHTLADYLSRISGAKFQIETADGQTGIAVGLPGDFPDLKLNPWDPRDPTRREDYLLQSHATGLHVIGATDLAVEYAVWDLLHRLGYRQFFPGETWEVVPRTPELAIAVDAKEHPAFLSRDIGFGFGPWDVRRQPYAEWCVRNRLASAAGDTPLLSVGHAWHAIVADRKDEFARHPEYFALVGGKRVSEGEVKFCISNAGLRKLVAEYAADYFTRHPDAGSISLEPSDGLGWCECEACRTLGSVSDGVATLLNEAAAAIRSRHGEKLIAIYAYAEHAPPPTIAVDPQVVVNVATAMTLGDFTTQQLIDGWRKQGAQIGIREYYGVYPWDRDLPGQLRTGDVSYLKRTIPAFYHDGARFMTAESNDSWGPGGLGYYLMARMLWDVREAERVEELTGDFLDRAFGPARKPMAAFYRLIDASGTPRISGDLIGRMYRLLDRANSLTDDPAIRARIRDLMLYARYVELYRDYAYIEGPNRQLGFEALVRYTWRIRRAGMVHSLAVWRGLPYYDTTVKLAAGVGYEVAEGKDPWKDATPITEQEIAEFLAAGIKKYHANPFSPVAYSAKLVPAAPLKLPDVPPGDAGLYFRDKPVFYTWAEKPASAIALTVKAGLLYQNVGPAKLALIPAGSTEPIDHLTVPPDQQEHSVTLTPRAAGLYRVELSDRTGGTTLSWPAGAPWTIPAGPKETTDLYSRWTLYFYVPKGTKVVAGYSESVGELHDAAGGKAFAFGEKPDYFSVSVPPGQDGRLWKFTSCLGKRILLTVPPYLARDARELILPEEVVKADRPNSGSGP